MALPALSLLRQGSRAAAPRSAPARPRRQDRRRPVDRRPKPSQFLRFRVDEPWVGILDRERGLHGIGEQGQLIEKPRVGANVGGVPLSGSSAYIDLTLDATGEVVFSSDPSKPTLVELDPLTSPLVQGS